MILYIEDNYHEKFYDYLLKFIRLKIATEIKTRDIMPINNMLESIDIDGSEMKGVISELILNLKYDVFRGHVLFYFKSKMSEYSNIPISKICQIIDQGTLDLKGTHIISDVFNYVKDNLSIIYRLYSLGVK